MPLPNSDIQINGEIYKLARQAILPPEIGATARRWQASSLPIGTAIVDRPDVIEGPIPGEKIIIWKDWRRGITGDHDNVPGCIYWGQNIEGFWPGALRSTGKSYLSAIVNITAEEVDPACFIEFDDTIYQARGRRTKYIDTQFTFSEDTDTGTGDYFTDLAIHDSYLVHAQGTSDYIWRKDTSGNWTYSVDAYATYLAKTTDGKLWRSQANAAVSNVPAGTSPLVLANWTSAITVGEAYVPITRLLGYGDRLAVCKEDGLYLGYGGSAADFKQIIKVPRWSKNGNQAIVQSGPGGDIILFPHRHGLLRYTEGAVEEVGPHLVMSPSVPNADSVGTPPGYQVTALAQDGPYVYAAMAPAYVPWVAPTGVLKTTNNEGAFTSYLSETTDRDMTTSATLNALDTAANGDYWYVGYSATFQQVWIVMNSPQSNASILTAEYWTGAAWSTAYSTTALPHDGTSYNGATLNQDGPITVPLAADWATKNINGTTAYWLRFSVSAALVNPTNIAEIRIAANPPYSYILRGRPREIGDVRPQSIIWEPLFASSNIVHPYIQTMFVGSFSRRGYGSVLFASCRQMVEWFLLPVPTPEGHLGSPAGFAVMARHDGGMPYVNKQFLSLSIKGKRIDSAHTVDLSYALDEATSFTTPSGGSNIATSPTTITLSNVTGYAIQPKINLDATTGEYPTEINEIECRFRVLETPKMVYRCTLEISDNQISSEGAPLPDCFVQLTNLEALLDDANTALIDPMGRSKTVTVRNIQIAEIVQQGVEYPTLLVEVEMAEL